MEDWVREGRFQVVKMDSVTNKQLHSSKLQVTICRPLLFLTFSCSKRVMSIFYHYYQKYTRSFQAVFASTSLLLRGAVLSSWTVKID